MVGPRKDGGWEGGRKRRVGGREQGDGGRKGGREGGRQTGRQGGREAGMMLCRERASVEEERFEGGRVDEGNERGRDGTGHGRREGKGREEASGGWIERGRE